MGVDHENRSGAYSLSLARATPTVATPSSAVSLLRLNMAVQDWVLLAFHGYILARLLLAPDEPGAQFPRHVALLLLMVTSATILLVRGEVLRPGPVRALVYRLGVFVPAVFTYFEMRFVLPALHLPLLDGPLLAIDEALFGLTPAIWLDPFNTRPVIEWFAFFYFCYFTILAIVMLPVLFFDRGRRLLECLMGALVVACLGHGGYTLVPGLGPFATMSFDAPIDGGFWWSMVLEVVHNAGAGMDIFPSLHTAFPTYFALHAFAYRGRAPFRHAWPILAFFAANIVVATLLLRWHYGIDVIFGLLLALTARAVAKRVGALEARRHEGGERQPVWEALFVGRR
jgi:hypothetical protein